MQKLQFENYFRASLKIILKKKKKSPRQPNHKFQKFHSHLKATEQGNPDKNSKERTIHTRQNAEFIVFTFSLFLFFSIVWFEFICEICICFQQGMSMNTKQKTLQKKKKIKKKKATNISRKEVDNNEKVAWTQKKILTHNNWFHLYSLMSISLVAALTVSEGT